MAENTEDSESIPLPKTVGRASYLDITAETENLTGKKHYYSRCKEDLKGVI